MMRLKLHKKYGVYKYTMRENNQLFQAELQGKEQN